jgi:hypothetical protein
MNSSNSFRFVCVDSTGILPLPRSAPLITRCRRECICNETSEYGLCAHHNVPASEVPQLGEPWCEVLDSNCLDLFNRPPMAVRGVARGSCETPNTIRTFSYPLPAASVNAMGLPPFATLVLGSIASRTVVVQPLLRPLSDGTARNGSLNDVFLDYETCFFATSVPSSVNRHLVCEVLLAPRTTAPTTSGSPMIDFPLNNVSYGVSFNRKTFVNRVRLRSSNLDTFQIVYGTTGDGFLTGNQITPPRERDWCHTHTSSNFFFLFFFGGGSLIILSPQCALNSSVSFLILSTLHSAVQSALGGEATFRYDDSITSYEVRSWVSTWIAVRPLSTTNGEQVAWISSFDINSRPCVESDRERCFFQPCQLPETCGGQGMLARLRVSALNSALVAAVVETETLLIPALNELYQPLDYVAAFSNTSWLQELVAINSNNSSAVESWSRDGTEKLLARPTHWTDSRLEKLLRFAEVFGKVSLVPGSFRERKGCQKQSDCETLLDGYQFVNITSFNTSSLLRPLVRVTLQDLIPEYAGENAATFDLEQDYTWFDDLLLTGGEGTYGENLAKLFMGPGELSRIMRVEVFNSALLNDRGLQPQRTPSSFYQVLTTRTSSGSGLSTTPLGTVTASTAQATTMTPTASAALVWPPVNRTAASGSNVVRLCHVLFNFDEEKASYFNESRNATIFPVVWNEWTLLWESFADDVFSGYETFETSDGTPRTLYCHLTTLRQINYMRVVDASLQPNYALLPSPLPARGDLGYDRVDPSACGTPYSQCLSIPTGYCAGWSCHKCKLVPTFPNRPVCSALTVTTSADASEAGNVPLIFLIAR